MSIRLDESEQHQLVYAVLEESKRIGMPPETMLTIMAYETGGRLDPWEEGPTTQWGVHRGFIQMGEPQRKEYGYRQDSSIADKVRASADYLVDRGWKPGMSELDAYSIVNAGAPGLEHRTDENNGGAPGTVADKVASRDWRIHSRRMKALLEKVRPSRALPDYIERTENQLAYENLRKGGTLWQGEKSLPEVFEMLGNIPSELSGTTDSRSGRNVPRARPVGSGTRGDVTVNKPLHDERVPLYSPELQTVAPKVQPQNERLPKVPVPKTKPSGNGASLKVNPFSLEKPNLKQQAEMLERNPVMARRMILAEGRDPNLFGLA